MAGYVKDGKRPGKPFDANNIAFLQGDIANRNGFCGRTIYFSLGVFALTCNAPYMIGMMMGNQDSLQIQVLFLKHLKHRLGLAGINDHGIVTLYDYPDIIIIKGTDG